MEELPNIWKSPQRLAAIDSDALSCYVRRRWTKKERNAATDVCGIAQPSKRDLTEETAPGPPHLRLGVMLSQ